MKLNNKGYMLVEIIVASVIALVMAYFLIDITIRLVNKNNDYYVESVLLTDKNLVTKEIMEDINDNSNNDILLTSINVTNSGDDIVTAELSFNNRTSKDLIIDKGSNIIKYGNYEKKMSSDLSIKEFIISKDSTQKQLYIRIPAYTNYSDIDYGISLVIPYTDDIEVILPEIKEDNTCDFKKINSPDLVDGLIPVVYDEDSSTWVKADATNKNGSWYNYCEKKWANAVLVTDINRSNYQNAGSGTTIDESDILAFYAWIPRYKYKVWNINKVIGKDSYNAQTAGIDIVFENEKESTGTINCNYDFSITDNSKLSETCTGLNGDYYTHPAFTFGSDELRGFWMGKFELSSSRPTLQYGGYNDTYLTMRILPNVSSWRYNKIGNFFTVIQNMQIDDNIYGLTTDKNIADSHMITNMEWGAVAYLTNSEYGRCTNGSCVKVNANNCMNYITGIGDDKVEASSSSTTCTTDINKYNGSKGVLSSTTGNVTGVYDMSGGADEYVMGNMSARAETYILFVTNSLFSSNWYDESKSKYVTQYAWGLENTGQTAFNRSMLGDATGEITLLINNHYCAWYSCYSSFPFYSDSYTSNAWILRGGEYNNVGAGIFYSWANDGINDEGYSSRSVLVSLK